MTTDVYNLQNEKVGTVEMPADVFGTNWNEVLVKQVLEAQLANHRSPWAHAKGRGEVRGGGKKPWAQKGTGRARHGSIRSPLWVGGGKSHGPSKDRDYTQKVNKKMKRVAMFAALSRKFKDGEIKVFDNLTIDAPKTKVLATALNGILALKKGERRFDVLLVPTLASRNLTRASSNLKKSKVLTATALNIYDILNYKNLFVEKDAVATIAKHYQL
jgi:large subunit ribosomal protein L4